MQRLAENMWRNRQMTYIEMLNRFNEVFPNIEIDDYRPFCDELTKGKSGIALWLSNGDSIMYFPKSEQHD